MPIVRKSILNDHLIIKIVVGIENKENPYLNSKRLREAKIEIKF